MIHATVNGRSFVVSGNNISITDDRIVVDGVELTDGAGDPAFRGEILRVELTGDLAALTCSRTVTVTGSVAGDVRTKGSVTVGGPVAGGIDAGGSVTVHGDVSKAVDAGGSVTCGNVGGSVDANGSVTCGLIFGNVDAGGSVRHG